MTDLFEIVEEDVRGVRLRVFKHAPPIAARGVARQRRPRRRRLPRVRGRAVHVRRRAPHRGVHGPHARVVRRPPGRPGRDRDAQLARVGVRVLGGHRRRGVDRAAERLVDRARARVRPQRLRCGGPVRRRGAGRAASRRTSATPPCATSCSCAPSATCPTRSRSRTPSASSTRHPCPTSTSLPTTTRRSCTPRARPAGRRAPSRRTATSSPILMNGMYRADRRGRAAPPPVPPRHHRRRSATLLTFPLFHVGGLQSFLLPYTAAGGKIVLMYKWDAVEAVDLIEREHVTAVAGVPTTMFQLLEVAAGAGAGAPVAGRASLRRDARAARARPADRRPARVPGRARQRVRAHRDLGRGHRQHRARTTSPAPTASARRSRR